MLDNEIDCSHFIVKHSTPPLDPRLRVAPKGFVGPALGGESVARSCGRGFMGAGVLHEVVSQ